MSNADRLKNLSNGTHLKGKFCGIHSQAKTYEDGNTVVTYSLILEPDLISNKVWVRFTKHHVSIGFHDNFKEEYVGKTIMVPVFYTSPNVYNGKSYQNIFYQGDDLPVFFN